MELFENLRKSYDTFYYNGYQIESDSENIRIKYEFKIEGLSEFAPSWSFPVGNYDLEQLKNDLVFKKLVFSLGMVELISYWKISCPKRVVVKAGKLSDGQIKWWKELYYYGLGEFFYTNNIEVSIEEFMDIVSEGNEVTGDFHPVLDNDRCLVPIGGGKDSAVSVELLKNSGRDICAYIINPRGATVNTVIAAGINEESVIKTGRTLDKRMIELNARGFLNGHTPYSAIVAFSSTMAAYLNGIKYITLSNEASANESTVRGSSVNHQYSKSFKFEKDFHSYEAEYIRSGTYYFSLLRPLSEFQIARYFSKCISYHDIFRSCNVGSKDDRWCGHCPKCLFVFLILSPFIEHERMVQIFGTDMVNDASMIPVMDQLIGVVDEKPFECVGSRDEVNMACCLTISKYKNSGLKLPVLYEHYVTTSQYRETSGLKNTFFTSYESENLLPDKFAEIIRNNCCME